MIIRTKEIGLNSQYILNTRGKREIVLDAKLGLKIGSIRGKEKEEIGLGFELDFKLCISSILHVYLWEAMYQPRKYELSDNNTKCNWCNFTKAETTLGLKLEPIVSNV